jgi:hypothetical protein
MIKMTYSADLKLIAKGYQSPVGSDRPIPYIILWVTKFYEGEEIDIACYQEDEPKLKRPASPSKQTGWAIVQFAVCSDQWKQKIETFSGIETQRGKNKVYKTLDAIVDEFKDAFDKRSMIQIRGI